MKVLVAILFYMFAGHSIAWAVMPDEVLQNSALEARARSLSKELRCMVCQNQSIDDSDAQLAKDLRVIVRERLVAGDSDAAIIDFVEARYGAFVLLKPRINMQTALLWGSPVVLVMAGLVIVWRRKTNEPNELTLKLTLEEESRIENLLKKQQI